MSFELQPIEGDRWKLVFSDEPSYIRALEMAPLSIEPELGSGVWLIVAFPVWSGPARDSIRAAISCARERGGEFHLGARPFESREEIYRWWPVSERGRAGEQILEVRDDGTSRQVHISTDQSDDPAWLVLRDGHVAYHGAGPRSKEQLNCLMGTVLGWRA
jgi:hypothetical protein